MKKPFPWSLWARSCIQMRDVGRIFHFPVAFSHLPAPYWDKTQARTSCPSFFPPTFPQSGFHRKENWRCGLDRSHHFSQQVSLDIAYNTLHTSSLPSFPICSTFLLTYIEMSIFKCSSLIDAMEKSVSLLLQNIQGGIVSTFWLFIQ